MPRLISTGTSPRDPHEKSMPSSGAKMTMARGRRTRRSGRDSRRPVSRRDPRQTFCDGRATKGTRTSRWGPAPACPDSAELGTGSRSGICRSRRTVHGRPYADRAPGGQDLRPVLRCAWRKMEPTSVGGSPPCASTYMTSLQGLLWRAGAMLFIGNPSFRHSLDASVDDRVRAA